MLICTLVLPATLHHVLDARPAFAFTSKESDPSFVRIFVKGLMMLGGVLKAQHAYNNTKLDAALNQIEHSRNGISHHVVQLFRWLGNNAPSALSSMLGLVTKANCDQYNSNKRTDCEKGLEQRIAQTLRKFIPHTRFRPGCLDSTRKNMPECLDEPRTFGTVTPNAHPPNVSKQPRSNRNPQNPVASGSPSDPQCERAKKLLRQLENDHNTYIKTIATAHVTNTNRRKIMQKSERELSILVNTIIDHVLGAISHDAKARLMKKWNEYEKKELADYTLFEKAGIQWEFYFIDEKILSLADPKKIQWEKLTTVENLINSLHDRLDALIHLQEILQDASSDHHMKLINGMKTELTILKWMLEQNDCIGVDVRITSLLRSVNYYAMTESPRRSLISINGGSLPTTNSYNPGLNNHIRNVYNQIFPTTNINIISRIKHTSAIIGKKFKFKRPTSKRT
jgi:hypothetical protein